MTPAKLINYLRCIRQEAGFTTETKITKDVEGNISKITSPTVVRNYVQGRLHGVSCDFWGTVSYHWNGVLVPKIVWTNPEQVTVDFIFSQKNAEVRRACLEVYGIDKIKTDKRCKIIHKDKENDRELFSFDLMEGLDPICYVQVTNATPEPDGTYKKFFLCVPFDKEFKTCHEAVAWTFDKTPEEYHPDVET